MDIVVMTHIPARNKINDRELRTALTALVKAVHPKVGDVGFAEGSENREGINAIQIKAGLNKATKDQLEDVLGELFGQKFEISYTREQSSLHRSSAIDKAFGQLL